ncbi:MAG: DoxX family protein [Campylobacterota bacterium]|nr:DoxX family protein [Campylobacterota bacterium]
MALLRDDDIGKLLLRVSVGLLVLFHGVGKIIHGVSGIKSMLSSAGMPEFFAYGVFIGEIIAPLMLVMGYYSRIAAAILAFNMFTAIYLAHASSIFSLNKFGAPLIELPLLYMVLSIAIFLFGPGKYSINHK